MKNKSLNPTLVGAVSLIVFGLIVSQLLESLFVTDYVDWYVSRSLENFPIMLSLLVGLIAGLCEELGYYFVFKHFFKNSTSFETPIMFGIGRGGLEFLFILIASILSLSLPELLILILVRLVGVLGAVAFSTLDYIAVKKTKFACFIAIVLHMFVNALSFAAAREYVYVTETQQNIIIVAISLVGVLAAYLFYRKTKLSLNDDD